LGAGKRATSAAARASHSPDGLRLVFEPRDWQRLADFAQNEAPRSSSTTLQAMTPEAIAAKRAKSEDRLSAPPDTAKSNAPPAVLHEKKPADVERARPRRGRRSRHPRRRRGDARSGGPHGDAGRERGGGARARPPRGLRSARARLEPPEDERARSLPHAPQ